MCFFITEVDLNARYIARDKGYSKSKGSKSISKNTKFY
jgi:hypothetical protein